jgi:hypothetical protein
VYAVGHRRELDDWRVLLGADLPDDLFETLVNGSFDDRAAILRASHDVVDAVVDDAVVRSGLVHPATIRRECAV